MAVTSPSKFVSTPAMIFSSVDFPQPFRPEHPDLRAWKEIERDVLEDLPFRGHDLADPAQGVDVLGHGVFGKGELYRACALTARSARRLAFERQGHDEAAAPGVRLASMPPRDLPHESEPEPRASPGSGAVERLEHALALGLGNPRSAVADGKLHAFRRE